MNNISTNSRKKRTLFVCDLMYTPDVLENGAILCEGENILAIGGISSFDLEDNIEVYFFENAYATPGFVDIHIHGAGGFDSSAVLESPKSLNDMSLVLANRGITSFVPTVVSDQHDKMLNNLSELAKVIRQGCQGAEPIGINVEGPFLHPKKCGAQDISAIVPIDLGYAKELIAAGDGLIKLMTFAPGLDNAVDLVELLCMNNIVPSMGHSIASEEKTIRAIDAGASHCTHLFNGMPTLHQRDMSITNVVLTDNRVTVELIIDGRHIDPRMVDLACRCKPDDRLIGISDCTMAAGMSNGEYRIGPTKIIVENGYTSTDGKILAGTTTMLDAGWHCLMGYGHLAPSQAARAVTSNAAKSIGFSDRGFLRPRLLADIAFFERNTHKPLMTVTRGGIVYDAKTNYRIKGVEA